MGECDDIPSIAICDDAGQGAADCVASSLAAEIAAAFGKRDERPFSIVAEAGGAVVGGLNGSSHWGWCYIRHLWVHAGWRRRGLGTRLLGAAQDLAHGRGCAGLYVDTFDAGAALFYERAGFTIFGKIEGFPPGHTRTFLHQLLASGGEAGGGQFTDVRMEVVEPRGIEPLTS